jgi:hypothetical protein
MPIELNEEANDPGKSSFSEHKFQPDEFESNVKLEGPVAMARAIQTLLVSKRGFLIDNPRAGMDVGRYNFEIGDTKTLNSMSSEAKDQISTFIPGALVSGVSAMLIPSEGKKNRLAFAIDLVDSNGPSRLAVVFEKGDVPGREVVSNFFYL